MYIQKRTKTIVVLWGAIAAFGLAACTDRPGPPSPKEPGFYIDDASVAEGNSGTSTLSFRVSLTPARDKPVSVSYSLGDASTEAFPATPGDDFQGFSPGTLTFAPGVTEKTVSTTVNGDSLFELDETFKVVLHSASGADVIDDTAIGTIQNDDPRPYAFLELITSSPALVGCASGPTYCVNENYADNAAGPAKVDFKVSLVDANKKLITSGMTSTIALSVSGSAMFRGDYVIIDSAGQRYDLGWVQIPVGESSKLYTLEIVDDGDVENDEQLILTYSDTNSQYVTRSPAADTIQLGINANDAVVYGSRVPAINDTGIIKFADGASNEKTVTQSGYPGQDADLGLDVTATGVRFVKLVDVNTAALADDTMYMTQPWACVRDENTKLIWEVKVKGNAGLHAQGRRVYWYNNDTANNGGWIGTIGHEDCADPNDANRDAVLHCNTAYYVADVNREALCGLTGWRLPTMEELRSIADYGHDHQSVQSYGALTAVDPEINTAAALNPNYFPYTGAGSFAYWSSTPDASNSGAVWGLGFYNIPTDTSTDKQGWAYIRLVNDGN